jgi:hypothetical protein
MGDERVINVADLRPGMKSISCLFIVLDIGEGFLVNRANAGPGWST